MKIVFSIIPRHRDSLEARSGKKVSLHFSFNAFIRRTGSPVGGVLPFSLPPSLGERRSPSNLLKKISRLLKKGDADRAGKGIIFSGYLCIGFL
jgi:hypothetical protein